MGRFRHIHVSLVRAFLDGLLGSPVPMLLVAKTLNSYSTHGLNSKTEADSFFPFGSSGTESDTNTERFYQNHAKFAGDSKLCWRGVIYSLKRVFVTPPESLFYLVSLIVIHTTKRTGGDCLPSKRKGGSGLDGVAENWTVVVCPGSPRQSGCCLCHLNHLAVQRWPRRT